MFALIISVCLLILFIPTSVYAWGPATHLEYASRALEGLALFPPAIRLLLTRHEDHFLYGSVAADITIGKGLRGYLYNCHNWQVALDLFHNKTRNDSQKAFMLGYLGHLAADTVAHNFFVPYKLIRSWNSRLLKHVYWEMRMDLSVPEKYWHMMEKFADNRFLQDDKLLEDSLKRTFFSFKTNKKIFNSLLILQRLRHYKNLAERYAKRSVWKLTDADIKNYKQLAQKSVADFLTHFEKSYCLKADPTGKTRMVFARHWVRTLREAHRRKKLPHLAAEKILHGLKQDLQKSIYDPIPPANKELDLLN